LRFGGYAAGPSQFVGGPREVAVDGDGNVWVGDMPGFRAMKFDSSGNFLMQVPNPAEPPPGGGFNQPRGVAVDQDGQIFVSDTHNWRIQKLDNDTGATFLTDWGNRGGGAYGFNYQRGLAVDRRNGDVVVADTDNHMIAKFTNDGQFRWEKGGFGVGNTQFANPHSVAVGPDGRIYVPDTQNRRVVVLDENGNYLYKFGSQGNGDGQFQFPRSVTVDPEDESIWVSDSIRGVVQHFSNAGVFLGKFGTLGSADNQLLRAADVEVNNEYVFVADVDTHKIKIWTKSGEFVGVGGGGGRELGQLLNPHGMDIAPDGTLYVTEQTGERVTQFQIVVSEPDTVAPTVTPTIPAANAAVPLPSVTVGGTASDNQAVARVDVAIRNTATGKYLRSDGSWGTFAWLPTTLDSPGAATTGYSRTFAPPSVGTYSFQSRSVDFANLLSVVKPTRSFTVFDPSVVTDTTKPTVGLTSPTANQRVPGPTITLQGTAADNVAVAGAEVAVKNNATGQWLRPNGTWGAFTWLPATLAAPGQSSSTFSFEFAAPGPGGYGFMARSKDTTGNLSTASVYRSLTVT
jgi:sugar lactone lactonase YvrE